MIGTAPRVSSIARLSIMRTTVMRAAPRFHAAYTRNSDAKLRGHHQFRGIQPISASNPNRILVLGISNRSSNHVAIQFRCSFEVPSGAFAGSRTADCDSGVMISPWMKVGFAVEMLDGHEELQVVIG